MRADPQTGQNSAARRSWISPVMVRVIASLVVGGVTYAITTFTGQSAGMTVVLSVFIGGVVLVVQYLADFDRSLTAVTDEQRKNLAQLNRATRLGEMLGDSPIRIEDVMALVETLTTIHNLGIDPISRLATDEWDRLTRFIQQLGTGETRYDGEDREWLLALTARAQGQIIATSSMSVDDGFWDSELGSQYLDMQREAAERGVVVRRIFLLDRTRPATDPAFQTLRKTQLQKQIAVRILDAEKLTPAQRKLYKDYVLFDKRIYYQVQPPSRRWVADRPQAAVVETLLSLKQDDVEFGLDYFEQLWDLAEPQGKP